MQHAEKKTEKWQVIKMKDSHPYFYEDYATCGKKLPPEKK